METRRREKMNAIKNGEVRKGNFYRRVRRVLKIIWNARNCPQLYQLLPLQRLLLELAGRTMKLPQIKYQSPINTFVHLILKHQYKISFLFLFLSFSSIFLSLQILSWYQSHLLNITQETSKSESKNKDKMTSGRPPIR